MTAIAELGYREKTKVEPDERFEPVGLVVSQRQELHPTKKQRRPEDPGSYRRADVIKTMGPQFVGVYLRDGQGKGKMYRVEEDGKKQLAIAKDGSEVHIASFDDDSGYHLHIPATKFVLGKIMPVGPWGVNEEPDDMMMNFVPYWRAFQDAPPVIQKIHLDQRANTLKALQKRGAKVQYTGRIGSYASWDPEDRGGQTVMLSHDQGHLLPDEFNNLGTEGIRTFRQESRWDKPFHEDEKSPSMLLCEPVAKLAEKKILPKHGLNGIVRTDQRGFTIEIPGFTIDDFRDAGPWLTSIFDAIHTQLARAHSLVYTSALQEVEDFALGEQLRGEFDLEKYRKYFNRRTSHDGSLLGMQLHALADFGSLRHGFGQVFGARFEDGVGAQFEFSTLILGDQPEAGPDEMRGVRLIRPPEPIAHEKVVENAIFLRQAV